MFLGRGAGIAATLCLLTSGSAARAEVPVQRTRFQVPSSNGHGAVLLDLQAAKLTHFREHLFATEEPVIDQNGNDVWDGGGFASVHTRDLLWDAYFGLRGPDGQRWLTDEPVDFDASGYAPWTAGKTGGTGIVTMVQRAGDLETTQYFFSPEALPHASFVMAMRVKNTGAATAPKVQAFTQYNFHLGYGRPGVRQDIQANGETITFDGSGGKADFLERAFAGVVVARPLAPVAHRGAGTGGQLFDIVKGGGDLPDNTPSPDAHDDSVSAYQFDLGDIAPGAERWCGVVFVHHGDPFGGAAAQSWLDAYVGSKGAKELLDAEVAGWAAFQNNVVKPPAGLSPKEETLVRQSAAMLHMSQNREDRIYLRQHLNSDDDVRRTRFPVEGGKLPGWVSHKGKGAVLASLPPGEWTYEWIRDGAYATVAMAALGMKEEAKASLEYYLQADSGRFQSWEELKAYPMPPYQISLVRYHGFGVEETDFNQFGPNLEFDGFGLFLWALGQYEALTGDTSVSDQYFNTATTKVADALEALVEKDAESIGAGLIKRDSSIWETHWKGRERYWAYTSITAARGLCEIAKIAERKGDAALATRYGESARALRQAIVDRLLDESLAIASNADELATGRGHYDAAVLDAFAFGLFDPKGKIATATFKAMDERLLAAAGAGWSRNDDFMDHAGGEDLSPWGGEYDRAEWVITNLLGSNGLRMSGDTARADRLTNWVLDQSLMNFLMVAETYDEQTGVYKFNAPMAGFGAGAYVLSLANRAGQFFEPACGAYFDESDLSGSSGGGASSSGTGAGSGGNLDVGDEGGCACRSAGETAVNPAAWLVPLAVGLGLARRKRR